MSTKRPGWLDRGLVNGPHLMLCLNKKDYLRQVKSMGVHQPRDFPTGKTAASMHGMRDKEGAMACIVCLPQAVGENWEPVQVAALLVHEAVHVWQAFVEDIGESDPSDEFMAYSIQSISQRLMYSYCEQLGLATT